MREGTLGRNLSSVGTVESVLQLVANVKDMREDIVERNLSSVDTVESVL